MMPEVSFTNIADSGLYYQNKMVLYGEKHSLQFLLTFSLLNAKNKKTDRSPFLLIDILKLFSF